MIGSTDLSDIEIGVWGAVRLCRRKRPKGQPARFSLDPVDLSGPVPTRGRVYVPVRVPALSNGARLSLTETFIVLIYISDTDIESMSLTEHRVHRFGR